MNNMTSTSTIQVRAMQGDTVDLICWRVYGEKMLSSQVVEQVLAMNHGLADLGAVLPLGKVMTLPVLADATKKQEVLQLWT